MKVISNVDAILFDMDGTLVDSIQAVVRSWTRWSERRGIAVERVLEMCHGRPAKDTIRWLAPEANLEEEAAFVLKEELYDGDGVVPIAGAVEFLSRLSLPWAVVTSATQELARHRLRLAGLPLPKVLVTVDMLKRGKPDPEGYLLAATRLETVPGKCLVVEDTLLGLQAGKAAGMKLLGISTTFPAEVLVKDLECEAVISDYRGIRIGPEGLTLMGDMV